MVMRLSLKTKHKAILAGAQKDYEALVEKYKEAVPITGKLSREIAVKRSKRLLAASKIMSITMILFRRAKNKAKGHGERRGLQRCQRQG